MAKVKAKAKVKRPTRTLTSYGRYRKAYDRYRKTSHEGLTDVEVAAYVAQAREQYHRDGEIEVDHNAVVSHVDAGGAYVLAWVWVPDAKSR
jgi:hypothetical protein